MKNLLLLSILFIASMSGTAQDRYNLIVFSEDGRAFDLYVNSIVQNVEPAANIRVTDLESPSALVIVKFEDMSSPDIKKNIYMQTPNTEVTYRVVETKKGFKLRYFGEIPMAEAKDKMPTDAVYTTTGYDEVVYENEPAESPAGTESTTTVITTTETISNETTVDDPTDRIKVDMDLGGISIDMDVDMGVEMEGTSGTVSSTTTTTTTTSTISGSTGTTTMDGSTDEVETVYVDRVLLPEVPCDATDIEPMKAAIEDETFQDDRLAVAKRALKGKCVTVAQIKELAELFTFEDNKLEFVKHAYDHCGNTDDYYQMNSVFTYSSSKEELEEYLDSK